MIAYLLILTSIFRTSEPAVHLPDLSDVPQACEQAIKDISFGERQVEQFICDRPDTAKILRRNNALRWMLIWHFAGGLKGQRIYWDNREPKGHTAEHSAHKDIPVFVQVTKTESGIDNCASLLFELLNRPIEDEYETLRTAPENDRKDRYGFALSCVREEFKVTQSLHWFFCSYPIAGATKEKDPYYTFVVSLQMDFETYILSADRNLSDDVNPLKYYGKAYDAIISNKTIAVPNPQRVPPVSDVR